MTKISRTQYEKALKADLNARRYVLLEKLNNCTDPDRFIELFRHLDLVNNHLECIKVRQDLRNSEDEKMKVKMVRASKEISYTKSHR